MKYQFTFIFLLFASFVSAQIAPDMYYVQFSDKNNSPYSINNPEEFLTARAIQRRQNQNIVITQDDIPVNVAYLNGVAQTGASLFYATRWLNGVTIETSSQSVLDAIAALPYVVSLRVLKEEPLKQQLKEKSFFKNEYISDALRPEQTQTKQTRSFDYGNAYTQINQINGIPLHEAGYRGQGMVIGILDGGFIEVDVHSAFDSIRNNGQILGTKDFVHPGGSVYTESSHGTSVLSTIAANKPGTMIGTAPLASFWLLRSEYVATEHVVEEYNWVSAAEFADSVGVDIINSSLSYIDFDFSQWNHTYDHLDGLTCIATIGADIASSKGILVVNSAGNGGSSSTFPYNGSPADGFHVFSIGAVKANGDRASFSSIGPTYDGRIKPNIMAMGQGTAVAYPGEGFSYGNGTSFSSPVIAGMSACLWQAKPNFTNYQIMQALMESGNNSIAPNVTYGYGIPDYMLANSLLTSIDTGDKAKEKLLEIYPNPMGSEAFIYFKNNKPLKITGIDIVGKIVFDINVTYSQSDILRNYLKDLKQGIYILNVQSDSNSQTIKLVKN